MRSFLLCQASDDCSGGQLVVDRLRILSEALDEEQKLKLINRLTSRGIPKFDLDEPSADEEDGEEVEVE